MCFGGDLDLYWSINNVNADDEIDYESFSITEENYYIYCLFEQLYNSVANCEVFKINDYELALATSTDEINMIIKREKQKNALLRNSQEYRNLFDGKTITWVSDENGYKKESIVKITKVENRFVLEFFRKLKNDAYNWPDENGLFAISIRFRNSGSSYQPFNQLFMEMYNGLEKYEPDIAKTLVKN